LLALIPDLLRSVTRPTYFLWGERDTFGGPDVTRALAELLPTATLEILPRGGHLLWLDDPVQAAQITVEFLGSN
jgi:pimeloyl-ACP methyl ester carboxylesterase